MKICPACNLNNLNDAASCACGHNFLNVRDPAAPPPVPPVLQKTGVDVRLPGYLWMTTADKATNAGVPAGTPPPRRCKCGDIMRPHKVINIKAKIFKSEADYIAYYRCSRCKRECKIRSKRNRNFILASVLIVLLLLLSSFLSKAPMSIQLQTVAIVFPPFAVWAVYDVIKCLRNEKRYPPWSNTP
jgi:hypothetical protein